MGLQRVRHDGVTFTHTHTHTHLGTTCPGRHYIRADSTVKPGTESQNRGWVSHPKRQRASGFVQSYLSTCKELLGKFGTVLHAVPPTLGQKPSYVYGCVLQFVRAERKAHKIAGQLKAAAFFLHKGRPYPGGREPRPPNHTPNREEHPRCQTAILRVMSKAVVPGIFTFAFKESRANCPEMDTS